MNSLWNDADARACAEACEVPELGLRVYTSRLLGAEQALVLHGGGNTSLKGSLRNLFGEDEEVIWVKGSGSDLAAVNEQDFAAVRLHEVRRMIELDSLDSSTMAAAMVCMRAQSGPKPSIETILHAILPWRYVEHTHADAILALGNTANGARILGEVFGDLAPLVPFRSSGFDLAKSCWSVYQACASARTIGLILHHHGLFAFGNSARESYENMLRLVTLAEEYLQGHGSHELFVSMAPFEFDRHGMARFRGELSRMAGFPLLLACRRDALLAAFAQRGDLAQLCRAGPATPQHAVFIKREPQLGMDVEAYAHRYAEQVHSIYPARSLDSLGLDPAPRAVIDAHCGTWVAAVNEHYLKVAGDILCHDVEIKIRASSHDCYVGLPLADLLHAEVDYGGFERELREGSLPLLGESVVVLSRTGQPFLCEALRRSGAAVSPIDPRGALAASLDEVVLRFGGIDAVILDADAAISAFTPLLREAPRGGRIVLINAAQGGWSDATDGIAILHVEGAPRTISAPQAGMIARLCDPAIAVQQPRLTFSRQEK